MSKFYITTPLYYVNDEPHIGHAYTTILADVLSRFQKIMGKEVFFLTGTDEHGQKVQEASEKRGLSPKDHADEYVIRFQDAWKKLNIDYDDFIRTTDKRHTDRVKDVLEILFKQNDIYLDEYEGLYSVSEERFITEKEFETGQFRNIKKIKEKNYFFKMSKYQNQLLDYITNNPNFIKPDSRKNEILGFLKKPLNDLCISRPKSRLSWGIELPFDNNYVTYVWVDALVNYISAIGWSANKKQFNQFWPADYHLIGKDILTTHAIYWSTILLALGIRLPNTIFAHGWWLIDDIKMSKSLGNTVKPLDLASQYGEDALRYYIMRNMVLGQDSSFTLDSFIKRYDSDLANDYGNLINRVLVLIDKFYNSIIPCPGDYNQTDLDLIEYLENNSKKSCKLVEDMKIHDSLELIFSMIRKTNKYLEVKEPWKTYKEFPEQSEITSTTLYVAAESIRMCTELLFPIMPNKTMIVLSALQISDIKKNNFKFGALCADTPIKMVPTLFPKIEQ